MVSSISVSDAISRAGVDSVNSVDIVDIVDSVSPHLSRRMASQALVAES